MLTFWETKRGVMFADTIIKWLPKLARKKKQTTEEIKRNELKERIDDMIADGWIVEHVLPMQEGAVVVEPTYLVVFGKQEGGDGS